MEDKNPQLKANIMDLIEPDRQADPSFKTTFRYTWITAERLHATLI
jgi:hypothetical protein